MKVSGNYPSFAVEANCKYKRGQKTTLPNLVQAWFINWLLSPQQKNIGCLFVGIICGSETSLDQL